MASLQIRDVDPRLLKRLKALAEREHRTLSHQVLFVLERFLESPGSSGRDLTAAATRLRDFWSGSAAEAPELPLPERQPVSRRQSTVNRILDGD